MRCAAGSRVGLRPGGRFVTVNCNPACNFTASPSYRKYGFETSVVGPLREGAPITWTFYLEDGPFAVENYFLSVEIHEEALRAAGFRDISWHQPILSPEGQSAHGSDYWSDLLDHPPLIFIECFLAKSRNIPLQGWSINRFSKHPCCS